MTQAAGEAQEVRRSFGLRMVVAVLGLVATFGTSVLAVRALDARPAAGFLAVLGALMLGPMVGRLGLGQSAIRAISAAPGPGEVAVQVVAHLRAVALLSLLTAPAVAWLATAVVQDDRGRVVLLVAAMIVLETVRLTVSDVFAALGRIPWSVAATHHSRSIIALVAMGVVVLASGGSTTLLTLLTVYAGTSLALLAVVLSALLVGLPRRARGTGRRWWAPMLAAVAAGAWLFTVELGAFLVGRGDVWLAGWAFGAQDALEYSTASVLAMQVTVLEGLANIAIAPVAARMWAAGEHARVFRLLSASATLSTAVTVLAVALAWLLGPQALALYGDGLGDAAPTSACWPPAGSAWPSAAPARCCSWSPATGGPRPARSPSRCSSPSRPRCSPPGSAARCRWRSPAPSPPRCCSAPTWSPAGAPSAAHRCPPAT
ncbi:hypothetical protein JD78_03912 [Modestobacter roseus]|uniref:O-antigen/teichoic acid export membrane protein n=1 Tax=Modestobacter roseus TaxID=1181884 RepID=A0A562IWW4_9ACTN|nr:teichoic acid transporter [Modestobacter roseus]TWH75356.1 hypothetical protein JD78_03912 [Modestobacter roseus]